MGVLVMRRSLRWLGQVERMDVSCVPKRLLVSRPVRGKRSVGGQKRRWNDAVAGDLKRGDLMETGGRLFRTNVHGSAWWWIPLLTLMSRQNRGEEG